MAGLAGRTAAADGAEVGDMKSLAALLLAVGASPACAHVHNVGTDIICTTTDVPPGLTLLPFLLLIGVGAVRAVRRHRKDR